MVVGLVKGKTFNIKIQFGIKRWFSLWIGMYAILPFFEKINTDCSLFFYVLNSDLFAVICTHVILYVLESFYCVYFVIFLYLTANFLSLIDTVFIP